MIIAGITKEVRVEMKHISKLLPKNVLIEAGKMPRAVQHLDHYQRMRSAYIIEGWPGILNYILPYYKPGTERDKIIEQLNKLTNGGNTPTSEA
jgi:hypothetical protein